MDITLKNFATTLPEVQSAIDAADFISIDTELTGLRNGDEPTAYDTPAEYYSKLRAGSLDFLLVQMGICAFKYDPSKNKYVYKAFNFYVFPRPVNNLNNSVNFLCQASSICFLTNADFDFNKLFKEGIPYLTWTDAENLQNELSHKYENFSDEDSFTKVPIPNELVSVVEDICKKIEAFLLPENEEKELCIDRCNGFLRKLVFQTAYEKFSTKNFSLSTKRIDNKVFLVAQKGKSKAEQDKENFEREKNELKDAIGFSKVIKYISEKKKLIIGHNMLLDICHIINRFCWPLPASYVEFKDMVHQLFPRIIDTKYMCSAFPFRDLIPSSVVNHMIKRLHEPPFTFPDSEAESLECGYPEDENKPHEAGYDAYITGLAFIALTAHLGKKAKQHFVNVDAELLKPYENRLFLMRIMDYSYVNLKGAEPVPKRNHVYHVTFPKEWKTSDIVQLFSPYGDIHVSYCNQTSAWVTLLDASKADLATSGLTKPDIHRSFSVITWETYENNKLSSSKTCVSSKDIISPVQNLSKTNDKIGITDKKRNSGTDDPPRKKKKKDSSNSEVSKASRGNEIENCDTQESPERKQHSRASCSSSVSKSNLLLDHLKGKDAKIRKTFEEPSSWD